MGRLGFRKAPANWSTWWLAMWFVATPVVIGSAFLVPFSVWIPIALVGFLLPEMVSIRKQNDSLPPLTHTIRHFLPNWLAFPLIYFALGAVGAHWLDFPEPGRIGLLMGLLGWLTDHFTETYARPDPFPYRNRSRRSAVEVERVPS